MAKYGKIKYPHLWAWDTMMASSRGWRQDNQHLAKQDNAPADAVYWKWDGEYGPDQKRVWTAFSEVTAATTRARIEAILATMARDVAAGRIGK